MLIDRQSRALPGVFLYKVRIISSHNDGLVHLCRLNNSCSKSNSLGNQSIIAGSKVELAADGVDPKFTAEADEKLLLVSTTLPDYIALKSSQKSGSSICCT